MKRKVVTRLITVLGFLALAGGSSLIPFLKDDFDTAIPMRDGGASTYYVKGHLAGVGTVSFMVDTGSGYLTINEQTLAKLQHIRKAHYLRNLRGVLADGSELIVPVYALSQLTIGDNCVVHNVEAAVFPGRTRQILGLSALRKAGPFIFSFDPPRLVLSNCSSA